MKFGVIRLWLDELEQLPEYSFSSPTGRCHGKTWKRRQDGQWYIGQYWRPWPHEHPNVCWRIFSYVELLQGPRKHNPPMRFKVQCDPAEMY